MLLVTAREGRWRGLLVPGEIVYEVFSMYRRSHGGVSATERTHQSPFRSTTRWSELLPFRAWCLAPSGRDCLSFTHALEVTMEVTSHLMELNHQHSVYMKLTALCTVQTKIWIFRLSNTDHKWSENSDLKLVLIKRTRPNWQTVEFQHRKFRKFETSKVS